MEGGIDLKLYIRAPYPDRCISQLREFFSEIVYEPWTEDGRRFYEAEMLEKLNRVHPDALITELDKITETVLAGYGALRFIGDCRAEPANIQVEACTKAGIPILCTPGRNNQAVAELVVALIIMHLRNALPAIAWAKSGGWVPGTTPYHLWKGHELQRRRVGFVGFGAVGRAAAKILDGFDCDICFYDPFIPGSIGSCRKVGLEMLFSSCDIVSLHLPVTAETKGMINESLLRSMKPTALFVNFARSAVVDTPALIRILNERAIAGAIIDVLDNEPPTEEDLLIARCPNTILTPHIGGATYEVAEHQADILNERIAQLLKGVELEKIVFNKDVLSRISPQSLSCGA